MALNTRAVDYSHGGVALQGEMVIDDTRSGVRPAVLVAHQWGGRDEFAGAQARMLAQLGYVGFALDMYGKGLRGNSVEENTRLMTPLMEDRKLLAGRIASALETVRAQSGVDAARVAAIGFCFGGLCVLDLARSGADLRGVASFHGLLKPPGHTGGNKIKAKVLVMHGSDDPMAPMEDVVALREELNTANADWQVHVYGHAQHAFAVPGANMPDMGVIHNADAERRSMASLRLFLQEVLA